MKYISTHDNKKEYSLSQAILQGLAPDGSLFIPKSMPTFDINQLIHTTSYPAFCAEILKPFFEGDPLAAYLPKLCQRAFTFDLPLKTLDKNTTILELFHGPTLSFKDFGARFLAECLQELAIDKPITIMVATSGDTGSAVASAFHGKSNIDVIILFPLNKISKRQQHQITCWGDNIKTYAVKSNFDDCQRLVKSAFNDAKCNATLNLCTANSINIGRLLPQLCYYAFTSLHLYQQKKQMPCFIIPSGNLGNITAAFWAKEMGFPIKHIVMATNANLVMSDYLKTGNYEARDSIPTLANAMDVGHPSNFERLNYLFKTHDEFKKNVSLYSISDKQIKKAIQDVFKQYNYIICPHTATAYATREQCNRFIWVLVGTADPCKFETIIEPIIHNNVPIKQSLSDILNRPCAFETVEAKLSKII